MTIVRARVYMALVHHITIIVLDALMTGHSQSCSNLLAASWFTARMDATAGLLQCLKRIVVARSLVKLFMKLRVQGGESTTAMFQGLVSLQPLFPDLIGLVNGYTQSHYSSASVSSTESEAYEQCPSIAESLTRAVSSFWRFSPLPPHERLREFLTPPASASPASVTNPNYNHANRALSTPFEQNFKPLD